MDTRISITTYDKIAKKYSDKYFNDSSDNPWLDRFASYLPPKARILDAGSGSGNLVAYLLGKGFDVTGIDLSEKMIGEAKRRVPEGKFLLMDIRRIKFPDNSFDGLLSAYSLVYIHSSEVPQTLREFYRVIRRGGYLLLIVQSGKPNRIVDEPLLKGAKLFLNFFDKLKLRTLTEMTGFTLVSMEDSRSPDYQDTLSEGVIYLILKK
jgi:ubiquinone/menaquinone biosynthesis C-methylase UbiE